MGFDPEAALPMIRRRFDEIGVSSAAGNLVNATAVGITQLVWRNGPIENARAGARGVRNGLHDGVMFARNTWVYHQALEALASTDPYALYRFEDRILDRELTWPGTDGTLSRFGYGALGAIAKHAKYTINYLMQLREEYPGNDFLLLAAAQAIGAEGRFGMPGWERRVQAAVRRLRGQDPAFTEWLRDQYNWDFAQMLAAAPPMVREDPDEIERGLRDAPYELGAETLQWLAWNPILDAE